jgi:iron complex transport system permease protein
MRRKVMTVFSILVVMLILSILLDISWAANPLSIMDVINVLIGKGTWATNIIVKDINAPRIVAAILVGSALAVCGVVMQAVFRNPMASPYIIGLSSGASLGAALGMLFTISIIPTIVLTPLLAFVFCVGTMMLVYSVSRIGGNVQTETLILSGIAVSAMISAMVSFLTFISGDKMEGIVFWSMGSLSNVTWPELCIIGIMIMIGIIILFSYSKNLNAMMLGDAHAMDLGVDVKKVRLIVLIVTSMVTASAVAFVGAIGFVGLIIPHIFRIIIGPDNIALIPISAMGGAVFLLLCDYISHAISSVYGVLPIGVITALVGAPYFIYLIRRRKNEVGWN